MSGLEPIRRTLALARHELALLLTDLEPVIVLIAMPIAMIAFLQPVYHSMLAGLGHRHATGAQQTVPGMIVMFAFFLVGYVGFNFFREHSRNTWERLRASPARPLEIIAGKILPVLLMGAFQMAVLAGVGRALFGFDPQAGWAAFALVGASYLLCLAGLGVALVGVCRTSQQVNAFANLGAILGAGLGGALVPVALLPGWVHAVAPAVPTYWAMRGFESVVLGGGAGEMWPSVLVLLAFTAGFVALAATTLRFAETKQGWE